MTSIIETTPAVITEIEPTMDDLVKAYLTANKQQKIRAYRSLKEVDEQAPTPVVVKRIQFEKVYTSRQVMQITGLSRNTVGKATRSGKLRSTRSGPHTPYLYTESAVKDWMEGRTANPANAADTSENPNDDGGKNE